MRSSLIKLFYERFVWDPVQPCKHGCAVLLANLEDHPIKARHWAALSKYSEPQKDLGHQHQITGWFLFSWAQNVFQAKRGVDSKATQSPYKAIYRSIRPILWAAGQVHPILFSAGSPPAIHPRRSELQPRARGRSLRMRFKLCCCAMVLSSPHPSRGPFQ